MDPGSLVRIVIREREAVAADDSVVQLDKADCARGGFGASHVVVFVRAERAAFKLNESFHAVKDSREAGAGDH